MEERELDYVLVPLGVSVMAIYHLWLIFTILRNPRRTVIGLNAESRRQWVYSMMSVSPLSLFNYDVLQLIAMNSIYLFVSSAVVTRALCILMKALKSIQIR